jgi:predicted TIM-barrel enzyme
MWSEAIRRPAKGATIRVAGPGGEARILCPWLADGADEAMLWASVLPIHDANAFLDDALAARAAPGDAGDAGDAYVGIFVSDPFRDRATLLARLRETGVARIINLPSVSFFDGLSAETFASLGYGPDEECEALLEAARQGFRVALCTRAGRLPAADRLARFDFVVTHEGPGSRFRLERASRS